MEQREHCILYVCGVAQRRDRGAEWGLSEAKEKSSESTCDGVRAKAPRAATCSARALAGGNASHEARPVGSALLHKLIVRTGRVQDCLLLLGGHMAQGYVSNGAAAVRENEGVNGDSYKGSEDIG